MYVHICIYYVYIIYIYTYVCKYAHTCTHVPNDDYEYHYCGIFDIDRAIVLSGIGDYNILVGTTRPRPYRGLFSATAVARPKCTRMLDRLAEGLRLLGPSRCGLILT